MEPPYNSERGARSLEGRGRQARSQQQQGGYDDYILESYGGDGQHEIEERQATYNSGKGGGEALMPYRYGYAVQDGDTGNDFNQQEQSNGDEITGQYSVALPDGRIQTVTYSVRPETGYVAEVTYTGEASFGPGVGGGGGGAQAEYGAGK